MSGAEIASFVLLPIGLGLFGFIEPCSLGSTLIFLKVLEGKPAAVRIAQVAVFTLARGLFIGLLGVAAVLAGRTFLGFQKAAWLALGIVYVALGLLYLSGRAGVLMRTIGPKLANIPALRGSAALGVIFGLNIPACAAPLLAALLGGAAAAGASGATYVTGFLSLGLFGLALSAPLVAAVYFEPARRGLDWIAGLSRRMPVIAGVVFIALGLWSAWFGLFVTVPIPA